MGVAHTFRVDSETAQVLVLSTPAGLESMVRDGAVPASLPTLPPDQRPRSWTGSSRPTARSASARRSDRRIETRQHTFTNFTLTAIRLEGSPI